MATSTVSFYKMKGSLSSGEYPLLTALTDLSSKLVSTASCKVTKDINQQITVPIFEGYEQINVVEFDGLYYWATSFKESTIFNGSVTYTIDLMAPTSFVLSGDKLKGSWHKLPTMECPYLRQEITNSYQIENRAVYPSKIDVGATHKRLTVDICEGYWFQIVGYDGSNNLKKWGGFLPYNTEDKDLSYDNVEAYVGTVDDDPDNVLTISCYPNYFELFENINRYTGLDASKIIDFSISKRCPYAIDRTDDSTPHGLDFITRKALLLLNRNNTTIAPTLVYTKTQTFLIPAPYDEIVTNYYLYDITNDELADPDFKLQSDTVTLTISDQERETGNVGIKDWNGNVIMTLPSKASHDITFQCVGDLNGLYTVITSGTQIMTIPEGKLPYLQNSWEYYKAYMMNDDRQAMENAIRYARLEQEADQISGTANTAINSVSTGIMTAFIAGSNPIGAAVGIGSAVVGTALNFWEQNRATELKEQQARDTFELTKRKAKNSPQTSYNVGYGAIYCDLNARSPLRCIVELPESIDSTYYNAWIAAYGHPAEGVQTVTIQTGYYQGSLMNDGSLVGRYFDELNSDFIKGFKFVTP